MNAKRLFVGGCIVATLVLFAFLTHFTVTNPDVSSVIRLAWLASPITFFILALFERKGRGGTMESVAASVFSPKQASWSFLYGDTILLPGAFVLAALKWQELPDQYNPPLWWAAVSLAVGALAGWAFHYKMDTPAYTKAGYAESLDSPTKLFHDFVSYPVLFGGLFYALLPLIFSVPEWGFHLNFHTAGSLVLIAIWLALGIRDGKANMTPWGHPKCDSKTLVCV